MNERAHKDKRKIPNYFLIKTRAFEMLQLYCWDTVNDDRLAAKH